MSEIKVETHKDEVLEEFNNKVKKALTECGLVAEGYAKKLAPVQTGELRNSITFEVVDDECFVGTNSEYGIYVEFGTGQFYAGGRKSPWTYQDSEGKWHMTTGMKPSPFIRPAVADNQSTYTAIIDDVMRE